MRYRLLFVIGIFPCILIGQNPLKKELRGNSTSMYYSPSQISFKNQAGATVYITELKDRRSINWNKQVNDSVKIEAIGDFWNYPMGVLFKNKINQDLSKAGVNLSYSASGDNMYKIEPTLDVLYPNFHKFPKKGYWVLSKINMQVSKGAQPLFSKSYQEYTFFTQGINTYKDAYNEDLKEGSNVAMWSSIKRLLDQFYKDLDEAFGGKSIQSNDLSLNTVAVSNIANDENLNDKVANYSGSKSTQTTAEPQNNYRMDGNSELPPPTDNKLGNAVNVLNAPDKVIKGEPIKPIKTVVDSATLAERKLREAAKKQALDSAKRAKEEMAKATKQIEENEKQRMQVVRDSILKEKKAIIAQKVREKTISDSVKKAEINQKIELARKKREEEKAKRGIKPEDEAKNTQSVEDANPKKTAVKKPSRKAENETIGEAVRRIAEEVEYEEMTGKKTERTVSSTASRVEKTTEKIDSRKESRERAKAEMFAQRRVKDSLIAIEKQKKMDSLMAIRKAKAEEIERAMARSKALKDSINQALATKRYIEDSIELVREKERRREAVMAAQKAAMETERAILSKNPNAGEMFATVSTDPPSKLPDNRTREQVLADRIFTPKSEEAKNLLARVKLITPEEEARMLAQLKTDDKSSVDSFFIQMQKNRPIPTYQPLDTAKKIETAPAKEVEKAKSDKKAEIIEKGLKSAKDIKEKTVTTTTTTKETTKATTDAKNTTKTTETVVKTTTTTKTEEVKAIDTVKSAENKAKELEDEIEKKTKELKEKLKKAKGW